MKFKLAARRAIATFIFSTVGMLLGVNVLDVDMATWKLILSTGVGSLLNLLFRWAENVVKEPFE